LRQTGPRIVPSSSPIPLVCPAGTTRHSAAYWVHREDCDCVDLGHNRVSNWRGPCHRGYGWSRGRWPTALLLMEEARNR
jgi:hypothetical protein